MTLRRVRWRNFKLVLIEQKYPTDPVGKLSTPRIINLVTDPQEREDIALPRLHTCTAVHFNRMLGQFKASTEREPTIPAGAPLDFVPGRTGDQAPAG